MYGSKMSSNAYRHLMSISRKHRTKIAKLSITNSRRAFSSAPNTSSNSKGAPIPPQFEYRQAGFGSKLFFTLFGIGAIGGGTLAYAKYDDNFRKQLAEYVPFTDDAIKMVFGRDSVFNNIASKVKETTASFSGTSSPPVTIKKESAPKSQSQFPDPNSCFANRKQEQAEDECPAIKKDECEPKSECPPPKKGSSESKGQSCVAKPQVAQENEKKDCGSCKTKVPQPLVPVPPPIAEKPKDHHKDVETPIKHTSPTPVISHSSSTHITEELSDETKKIGGEVCAAYRHGIAAFKEYKNKVHSAMEHYVHGNVGKGSLEDLKRATKNKMDAELRVQEAVRQLDACVGPEADKLRETISALKHDFNLHKTTADVASKFWPQVEEARKQFVEEIEAIFPHADITSEKMDTRGGDTDALLLVALRKVVMYKQQLAKLEVMLSDKVDKALEGSDEEVMTAKVELALEKERRSLEEYYQKKLEVAKAEWNKEMSAQLKRQLDIHQMHLKDTLDSHAQKILREEQKVFEEKLAAERAVDGVKLATVVGRLQGVDKALKARSDVDKMAKQAQLLWVACEALEGVLRGRTSTDMRVSVSKELDAIASAAADTDELVASVLRGVPPTARENGVLSEVALRDRFIKLEKVCRSLALVPAQGGGLHMFLLSWLQGKMMAKASPPSPKELQNEPTNFTDLDTYDILERARYFVDRGQWEQALRYVHLLKGAASTISQDWAKELTLHLEARQAANALLAHAAASGLVYL